jgi:hypothetical protein
MVRMILAHPRSRSNLLGSAYPNYLNEVFTPGWIETTQFYRDNKEMLKHGTDYESPFVRKYIEHLRHTLKPDMDFTFKVHYCGVKNWPEAQDLIKYWSPSDIVACHRSNKKASLLSVLLADKQGYTSFHNLPKQPFAVTEDQFNYGFERVVTDWFAGLAVYKPTEWYEYDTIPAQLCARFKWNDERYQAFLAECKYKDQRSKDRLWMITNMEQVNKWWDAALKELT